MGHIKEPVGINFIVDPTPLKKVDKDKITEVIAYYKATGRKLSSKTSSSKNKLRTSSKKKVVA